MAFQADLLRIFFLHEGSLPATFWIYPLRTVHYVNSRVLMGLIGLHLAGALYHTFISRDGLLRRMTFGNRFGHELAGLAPTIPRLTIAQNDRVGLGE
jgi:cytochrome b561